MVTSPQSRLPSPPGGWRVEVEVGEKGVAWVDGVDVWALAFLDPAAPETDTEGSAGRWWEQVRAHPERRPPACFDDREAFGAWLARRDHAGAVGMMRPRLWLDETGDACGVTLSVLDPVWGAGFDPDGEHRAPGPLDPSPRVEVDTFPGGMRLVHWQRFDLRDPTALDGRYDSAAPAPWGWLRITYDLRGDGTSQAWVASSFVPTTWFYRDGVRQHRADPRDRSATEIAATLVPRDGVATGSTWAGIDCSTNLVHVANEVGT